MLPASLSALLEAERVTVWYSVPTALVQLSLRGELASRDLRALRWVLFAGETFPGKHLHRVLAQLPGTRFSHVYGSTEVNVCTYHHLPDAGPPAGPLPIGRACANTRTLIVDEALQPVGAGEPGELLVRGSTVMSGYWGDPERNAQALVRRRGAGGLDEIYFRTGDRVRALEDGTLAFVARGDRQVKVRGYRVELEEVETALLSLPEVEEAAVLTVPDGEGSASIRAAVVASGTPGATPRDIVAGVRRILPPHAVPAAVSVLPALPRTPTGKVDGRALRAQMGEPEDTNDH
jgi:acyl-coenzyme A synthetase/AMP-(fatty) acid ligase